MHKIINKLFGILAFFVAFLIIGNTVFAVDIPNFATCPNPNGSVIASYEDGDHGIVGDYSTHTGRDSVYQTTSTTDTQCYCPGNNYDGIQTDWWNVSGLSQQDITGLISNGWIFVPNGSVWGLEDAPYLAKNINFACSGGQGGGSTLGSSDPGDPSTGTGGQVLGANTTILANTSSALIFQRLIAAVLIAFGLFFILAI
ncbi:hypothetical protein BH10PAT1_BH10PAT1_6570 [soil metagenome]